MILVHFVLENYQTSVDVVGEEVFLTSMLPEVSRIFDLSSGLVSEDNIT
jgi:hypothetical protein